MPVKTFLVAVLLAGLSACTSDRPATATQPRNPEPAVTDENSAARAAGRAAYHVIDKTKKAAKRAGRELREAGKEAREGWKEEKQEEQQQQKPSPMPRR